MILYHSIGMCQFAKTTNNAV